MSNIPAILATEALPSSLYALEQAVLGWAQERNLIEGSTCRKQLAKTCEEFGELAAGLNKGKRALIKDGVGDVLVTLIIANGCAGSTPLFNSAEAENKWIAPAPHVCRMEASELVHELLMELAYISRNSWMYQDYRTSRMKDMVRALNAASAFAECGMAECLQAAWLEIKDRKGRMVEGVFIKEADLPCPPDHNC